ncbi:MAG: hypothetical protein AB7M12_09605 [Hyphomonadaceae bacterium]
MQSAPFDLEDAWAALAEVTSWIAALFGLPAAIAQRFALTRRSRAAILAWLAPAEALARRLLCIEAASLPAPNAPAPFAPKGRLANALRDAPARELDEDSARWRVAFSLGFGSPAFDRPSEPPGSSRPFVPNAAALARRLEALLRVPQDRVRLVRRLAQRLHAASARAVRAFTPYRHRAPACASTLAAAQTACDAALARFADTS